MPEISNQSTQSDTQHVDVVVAGGGLSGTLTALSLAQLKKADGTPLKIAIIEANTIKKDASLTFDDRVIALAHASASYFDDLGIWTALVQDATPIKDIHVSDRGYYGKARIAAVDHQISALGYVVEMSLIGQALLTALAKYPQVSWFSPDSIEAINWQQQQVAVDLVSKQRLVAKLLVACDGGQSVCRQFAGIAIKRRDYQQSAVIANVATEKPHDNVAFERFTQSGPLAMLPMSKQRCSLVWTLTPTQAQSVYQLNDDEFANELELAFGGYLGAITQVGRRSVFPLSLVQAEQQIYHRMALVGNASHTIHPIAGQGFNLGVRDVKQLVCQIAQAIANEQDIGNFRLLHEYQLNREQDQQTVISLTDSLVTLFSNDLPPLVAGRNIGLKVINYCSALQRKFVDKSMGY